MQSLSDLQHHFGLALRGVATSGLFGVFVEEGLQAEKRISAYRRNVWGNWRAALGSTYPVTAALVGHKTFSDISDAYIAVTPSTDGDLNAYGGTLPAFLRTHPIMGDLPYLADVAELESALLHSYGSEEPEEFDFEALAKVPVQQHEALRLKLWSGARLLTVSYPVDEIWQAHQSADAATRDMTLRGIALTQSQLHLVCARTQDGALYIERLDEAAAAFWRSISSMTALAEAVDGAPTALDVPSLLHRWTSLRLLVGFHVGHAGAVP